MDNNATGVVPVMNVAPNSGYGDNMGMFGGCMWFMWIIIIFALMGGGWNTNNNRGYDTAAVFANGSMTRDQISDQFAMQDIKNGVRGVQNGLCDGFYAQNSTMLNGFNGLQRDICYRSGQLGQSIMQTGYELGNQIAQNRFAAQQCCCETQKDIAALSCETNRNIDAVRAENYRNTCEVVNAINADGEKTRALMVANQIQDLRDKLADRDRDLQTANFHLSQQAQNTTLIGALRPTPIPAYITYSPYQGINTNGCVCGACGNYA